MPTGSVEKEGMILNAMAGLPEATMVIDRDHTVIFWNSACARLTGVPASSMLGTKNHWAPFYSSQRPHLADLLVDEVPFDQIQKISGGRFKHSNVLEGALEGEEYFSGLGGRGKWIMFLAAPVKDASGKITGAVQIIQDISQRKFDDEALRNGAEELNVIFQNSGDAICIFDINYDIVRVNPAMEKMFQRTTPEFVKKKCYDIFQSPDCQTAQCPLKRIRAGEGSVYRDVMRKRSDGVEVAVECVSTPIKFGNIVIGMISAYRDVTERKLAADKISRMAQELKKINEELEARVAERTAEAVSEKKKAEDANMAKSMFLANMSHELRTPLHGIINFADFGIEKHIDAPKEKILKYFQKIRNSSQVLLNLVNDLLDLSKLESGRMDFELNEVAVAECLHKSIEELSPQAAKKNIKICYEDHLAGCVAFLDEPKILQVLRNLLSNAIKFSYDGGVIRLLLQEDRDYIKIGVIDNGIGIPEGEFTLIFDKFVQSTKTRSGAGGTGLGLSISKEIVEAHKGHIWVERNPAGGSIFYFTISKYLHSKPSSTIS